MPGVQPPPAQPPPMTAAPIAGPDVPAVQPGGWSAAPAVGPAAEDEWDAFGDFDAAPPTSVPAVMPAAAPTVVPAVAPAMVHPAASADGGVGAGQDDDWSDFSFPGRVEWRGMGDRSGQLDILKLKGRSGPAIMLTWDAE